MEKLCLHPRQREDRHKRQNDDSHCEENWMPYHLGCIQGDLPDSRPVFSMRFVVLLGSPEDVLGHYDSRIHQHADSNCDPSKGHDVRRNADVMHEEERAKHSQRQGQCNDEDAAEMPQEKYVGERDQDNLFDQGRLERIDGMPNEITAVVEGDDVNTFGQPRFQSLDLLFHRVDDLKRVSSVTNHYYATDHLLTCLVQHAPTKLRAKVHISDIADIHGSSSTCFERDVVDVGDGIDQPNPTYRLLGVVDLQNLSAHIAIATLHR